VMTFWNDSKGTNPAATLRSLEGLADGSVHLILGGRAKGTDFRDLAPRVRRKVRRLYLVGEAAEEIETALAEILEGAGSSGGAVPVCRCGTLDRAVAEAVAWMLREPRPGDSLLLSPACASFDQFRSFAHRGDEFRRAVHETLRDLDADLVVPDPADPSTEEARDGDQARV
jgi:UDP-N-acetylmuramoylalanine--D-glutamate ligase